MSIRASLLSTAFLSLGISNLGFVSQAVAQNSYYTAACRDTCAEFNGGKVEVECVMDGESAELFGSAAGDMSITECKLILDHFKCYLLGIESGTYDYSTLVALEWQLPNGHGDQEMVAHNGPVSDLSTSQTGNSHSLTATIQRQQETDWGAEDDWELESDSINQFCLLQFHLAIAGQNTCFTSGCQLSYSGFRAHASCYKKMLDMSCDGSSDPVSTPALCNSLKKDVCHTKAESYFSKCRVNNVNCECKGCGKTYDAINRSCMSGFGLPLPKPIGSTLERNRCPGTVAK